MTASKTPTPSLQTSRIWSSLYAAGVAVILLGGCFIAHAYHTPYHPWGDDYTRYLSQTLALTTGDMEGMVADQRFMFENTELPSGPLLYPWGHSLLFWPWVQVVGIDLLALKNANLLYYLGYLLSFYGLIRKRFPPGLCLTGLSLAAFSPSVLGLQDLLLSDHPFLFLSTLTLLVSDRLFSSSAEKATLRFGFAGALTGLAYLVRTNGILLMVPIGCVLLIRLMRQSGTTSPWKKFFFESGGCLVGLSVVILLNHVLLPQGSSTYVQALKVLSVEGLAEQLGYYIRLTQQMLGPTAWMSVMMMGLVLIGLWRIPLQALPLLAYMGILYLLYILWPFQEGVRFLLPILPLWLLLSMRGCLTLQTLPLFRGSRRNLKVLTYVPLLLIAGVSLFQFPAELREHHAWYEKKRHSHSPTSLEMFDWIRTHTQEGDVVSFHKPGHMLLYTGRRSFALMHVESEPNVQYIVEDKKRSKKVQYAERRFAERAQSGHLVSVFNNRHYRIFKVTQP